MVSPSALAFRYALFAVITTFLNLASQRLVLLSGDGPVLFVTAMLVGTAVGLVVKFVLDKKWIFYDEGNGLRDNSQKFTVYALFGVVTTAIFWACETIFWICSHREIMREIGAMLGLTIGYIAKYHLDRRFVFKKTGASL